MTPSLTIGGTGVAAHESVPKAGQPTLTGQMRQQADELDELAAEFAELENMAKPLDEKSARRLEVLAASLDRLDEASEVVLLTAKMRFQSLRAKLRVRIKAFKG